VRQVDELIAAGDTRLFVSDRGDVADFPIIVLHGGPGLDHHEFLDYLDPLTDRGFRLLLVDQRSQGRSDRSDESTWTLVHMAEDVRSLAATLGLDRYAVLGHSYGALVALQNAVSFPDPHVFSIVSSGFPSLRFLDQVQRNLDEFEPIELREQITRSWESEASVVSSDDLARLMEEQYPFHFADPRDPRIDVLIARSADTVYSPDVLRAMSATGYGGIDLEHRLGEVRQPVLVLAGRHDRTCSVEASQVIADGVVGAELHIFENSAHMSFIEQTREYLHVVEAFLKSKVS
jgi:proline-specific peptidase